MIHKNPTVSVIISTYSRPDALRLILLALANQNAEDFEIIVADDGSDDEIKKVIESFKSEINHKIKHVWHPDDGFRLPVIRNKAVVAAEGDYLIFFDGDAVPSTTYISRHQKIAEKKYFVSGSRVLLSQEFTEKVLSQNIPIYKWKAWQWLYAFSRGWVNRFLAVLYFGVLYPRYLFRTQRKKIRGCNLAMWKKDFLAVNGFDEAYLGWGYEDSDLVIRLIRNGVLRKDGRFAVPVFHLWHASNVSSSERDNYKKLQEIEQSSRVKAVDGVTKY